ncbi:Tex family protein [Anaerobacillus isosaccharinicus]|uniref:RNA-binding transcriptional accessory protein n=1 Tax=Anaerobacillus isosaccharinicus TaxID=1532552 RepID=A0A1S2MFV0_9BACI|nr:Tex family protein [Anaerobacillus isosaccharinicus]MBA5588816.1 RNA-binding transcriptional accessory protein [Anaerobacillus isosaccharinicus]QOY38545.1 RNA-binding transcriptional accessory protein [Anaerobacillus isosaccharinicus]
MLQLLMKETAFSKKAIENVVTLIEEGNTVPFIARYRKELTGSLDEVQIRTIVERWTYINNLETRKEEVIRLIQEQDKLTDELQQSILKATKLQEVEDLYRPYKQKRRTKATVAKEKGLEPLATWLITFPAQGNVEEVASQYLSEEKEVLTVEDALQGAQDIVAEWVSDDPEIRKLIRQLTFKEGKLVSASKDVEKDEKGVYEMYYEYEEQAGKIVPHRVLALNRGEKEGILKVALSTPVDKIISIIERKYIKNSHSPVISYVKEAISDSYKRLIEPSIEREIRKELSEKAEDQAIHIFSENLRNLLLQPPLKGRVVLGVDPAYRTGCKLAVVDDTGKVLHISVIYPTPPKSEIEKGKKIVQELIKKHDIEVVAIGNGTASRETEQFIADVIKEVNKEVYYLIVNEAGASVYSASPLGREEFPDLQVEERSAISIARRLQDPLAELVKIDPKSVGVGQYQHDVTQSKLNDSLTFVVETVVNQVGVNVNTASGSLLQYVAGLSKSVANNIVKKREEEGKFTNRGQLKKIPRLGAKTYEQCIGFLRVIDGDDPLDQTGIHPESYKETKRILKQLGAKPEQIGSPELSEQLKELDLEKLAADLEIGVPTLKDIVDALMRPLRDPRDEVATPLLKKDVLKLEDLQTGMELQGTIRNVVDFGAFVDIGVKQDGLVHISKLTNRFVKHPMEVVSVGDVVTVWVDSVDAKKQRVALTMLKPENQI